MVEAKKWAIIIGSVLCLAIGIVISFYIVPPTQKIVENIIPNNMFFKDAAEEKDSKKDIK